MARVGSLERQLKRDASGFLALAFKCGAFLLVLFWPIALITGEAFGKHPGVLAAECGWLPVLWALYSGYRKSAKSTGSRGR